MAYFSGSLHWRDEPLARALKAGGECAELDLYLARIAELRDGSTATSPATDAFVYPPPSAAPMFLLAHAYVRYMGPSVAPSVPTDNAGDLSGGQLIREAVSKAYGLTDDGRRFYDFGTLEAGGDASEPAQMSELKRIKHWYREAIDAAGVDLTDAQKCASARPQIAALTSPQWT